MQNLRNKIGIPLFVVWAVVFSFCIAKIDSLECSSQILGAVVRYDYIIFLALLFFVNVAFWIRTLMGLAFCGFLFATTFLLAPKVPYDAPGSIWIMMISMFTKFLPIVALFGLYAIIDLVIRGFYNTTMFPFAQSDKEKDHCARKSTIITLGSFLLILSVLFISVPILRNMATGVIKNQLARSGYIFNAGAYKLNVPSLYVKNYKMTRLTDGNTNKGTVYTASDGRLEYILELRLISPELNKEYLNSKQNVLKERMEESYRALYSNAPNLVKFDIGITNYLWYPKLFRTGYESVVVKDNKEYVKIGVVMVVHTRIYLDISVVGLRKDYDSGLIKRKFNQFMNSLDIMGEMKT